MNKLFIFVVITLFLIAGIAGCSNPKTDSLGKDGAINRECESPYIMVGADCCLDNNKNGICDSKEVITSNIVLLQGLSVSEKCDGGNNLECVAKKIGVDSVKIKLQSKSKDFIKVKEINLPGLACLKDFSGSSEMRFNDAQDFEIPCKAKYTTIDTDIIILEDIKNVKVKSSGEVYEISSPIEMTNSGHISGKVEVI